jgi:hypothetical protein
LALTAATGCGDDSMIFIWLVTSENVPDGVDLALALPKFCVPSSSEALGMFSGKFFVGAYKLDCPNDMAPRIYAILCHWLVTATAADFTTVLDT